MVLEIPEKSMVLMTHEKSIVLINPEIYMVLSQEPWNVKMILEILEISMVLSDSKIYNIHVVLENCEISINE